MADISIHKLWSNLELIPEQFRDLLDKVRLNNYKLYNLLVPDILTLNLIKEKP